MHPQLNRNALVVDHARIILPMVFFESPRHILFCKIYTALNGGFLKCRGGSQPTSLGILHREYPEDLLPLIRELHLEDFLELVAVYLTSSRGHCAVYYFMLNTCGRLIVVSAALIKLL